MNERRKAYVEKLKAQLDEWNADIDKLEAKAKKAEAEFKAKYEDDLAKLHLQRTEVKAKLAEIQDASEEAWEDLRYAFEKSWDIYKESIERAISRFK